MLVDLSTVVISVDPGGAQVDQTEPTRTRSEGSAQCASPGIFGEVIAMPIGGGHIDDGVLSDSRKALRAAPLVQVGLKQQASTGSNGALECQRECGFSGASNQNEAWPVGSGTLLHALQKGSSGNIAKSNQANAQSAELSGKAHIGPTIKQKTLRCDRRVF